MSLHRLGSAWAAWALASILAWGVDFVPVSGEWNDPANWNPAQVPTLSNDVTIGSGKTVRHTDTGLLISCRNLVVDGTLDLSQGSETVGLTCGGNLTVNGTLRLGGATGGVDGRLTMTKTAPSITGTGTLLFGPGSGATTLEVGSGSRVAVGGSLTLTGSSWRLAQAETSDGGMSYESAVVTLGSATQVVVTSGAWEILNGLALTAQGAITLGQGSQIRYDLNAFSRFTASSTSQITWTVNGNGLAAVLFPGSVNLAGSLTILRPTGLSLAYDDTVTWVGQAQSLIQGNFTTIVGGNAWATAPITTSYQLSFILEQQRMSWAGIPTAIAPGTADITLPATSLEGRTITYTVSRVDGSPATSTFISSRVLRPANVDEDLRIVGTAAGFVSGASTYDALYSTHDLSISSSLPQTVTIDPLPGPFYYGETIPLSGSCTSGATLAWSTADGALLSISGQEARVLAVSTQASLTATAPVAGVYRTATTTTTIGPFLARPVTVTVDGGTRVFGETTPSPSLAYDNLAAGDLPAVLGTPVFSGSGLTTTGTSAVGTYPVTATFPSISSAYVVTVVPGNLTIIPRPQTVTFPAIANVLAGQTATLGATSSLGLAITYTSSDTTVATVTGSTLRAVGAGTATITASQAGNATTDPASATQTVQVSLVGTITIGSLTGPFTYGDRITLSGTTASGGPITWSSTSPLVAISGSTATVLSIGSGATVTATTPATSLYAAGSATATFGTFRAKAVTATVASTSRVFGATNPSPSVTITGLADGDTASTLGSPLYGGTGTTAGPATVAGTYPITVSFSPANPNYTITVVPGALTITKTPQVVTFPALTPLVVGQSTTLAATSDLGLALTYASSNSAVATVSGTTLRAISAGSATITATQAGSTTVEAASATEAITVLPPTVFTLGSLTGPFTYGDTIALTGTVSSGAPITWSSTSPLLSIQGTTATVIGVGSGATVTATCPATGSFLAGSATATCGTFQPKAITVTVSSVSRIYGAAQPTLTALVSGMVLGEAETVLGTPTFSGTGSTAGSTTAVGSYPLTVTYAPANPNYALTVVPGTLTITARTQTLTFPPLANLTLDQTAALAATSDLGLPLTYTTSDPAVATVTGGIVTAIAAGTVTITAQQPGDATALAASATQSLTVTGARRAQTITVTPLPTTLTYGQTLTLTGTCSSGQALTWSSTATPVRITGTTLTLIGTGAGATLTASAPQTTGYLAATTVVALPTILARRVVVQVGTAQRPLGDNPTPPPSFIVTDLAPGDTITTLGTPTYSGPGTTTNATTSAGTYPITVSFSPTNPNYTLTIREGSLRIIGVIDIDGNEVTGSGSRGCGVGGTGLALLSLLLLMYTNSRPPAPPRRP